MNSNIVSMMLPNLCTPVEQELCQMFTNSCSVLFSEERAAFRDILYKKDPNLQI